MGQKYSGNAAPTTATAAIASGATSFTVVNATNWPTGGEFVVLVDAGTAQAEKMLCTRSGNVFTVVQRGYDGTPVVAHTAAAPTVRHVIDATSLQRFEDAAGPKTIRIPHTWHFPGDVKVASGDTDYILPFFVPIPAGQTATLVGVVSTIRSGWYVDFTLDRKAWGGAEASIFSSTGIGGAEPSPRSHSLSVALANLDALRPVLTNVSGAPKNLSVTIFIDYTVG